MPSVETIYLAAILHGLFLVALLSFGRRSNQAANRMLAFLIGLISLSLWNIHTRQVGLPSYWKLIDYLLWASPYLWGPALHAYVCAIARDDAQRAFSIARHFSLGIGLALLQIPLFFLIEQGWLPTGGMRVLSLVVMFGLYLQMGGYIVFCVRTLARYEKRLKEQFASTTSINLVWLQRLTAIFAIFVIIDMSVSIPAALRQIEAPYFTIIMLAEAATIFAIGYFSLRQPEVLMGAPDHPGQENPGLDGTKGTPKKPKYDGSPIDGELATVLASKLKDLMVSTEIYKKNDLRLQDLSDLMGVSPHHLSQVINQEFHKNFYDFVNEYRVTCAAATLASNDRVNITKLAFESGFNNRVSFNNAFKKYLGATASAYHREHSAR